MEVGTHSPWVSRLLKQPGIRGDRGQRAAGAADQRQQRKNDRMDAQTAGAPGASGSAVVAAHPAPQRAGAGGPDDDPGAGALVEARTGLVNAARGLDQGDGGAAAGCDADAMGVERMEALPAGLRERAAAAAGRSGIVDGEDPRIGQQDRADRPDDVSGNRTPAAGERSRDFDRSDVCVDGGGSRAIPEEPGRGLLCGLAAEAKRIGAEPAATADHQGRGPVSAEAAGAGGALHSGAARTGHGSEAVGAEAGARGGKNAKKRAMVAVARKLAVLLHRLWVTGEVYEPLRNSQASTGTAQTGSA